MRKSVSYFLGVFLGAVSINAISATAPTVPIYTENQLVVSVKPGEQFKIQLSANPSTGYTWYLKKYDARLIEPLKHNYIHSTANVPGAPGKDQWLFRLRPGKTGTTKLDFVYLRPWENVKPAKELVFKVAPIN